MRQQGREHVPAAGLCRDRIPQDWWISGFLAAIGLATVIPKYPDAMAFILSVAAFLAAGLSGWWPRSSTMVTTALTAAFVLLGVVTPAVFAMDIPLLMACVKRNHQVRNITAILAAALQTAIIAPVSSDEGELLLNLLFCLSLIAAAWVMGSWISHYVTRLSRLENERQQMIHAVRVSLARNLHDTAASAMNRIIMHCEQVKLRGIEDPVMLQDIDFLLQEGRRAAPVACGHGVLDGRGDGPRGPVGQGEDDDVVPGEAADVGGLHEPVRQRHEVGVVLSQAVPRGGVRRDGTDLDVRVSREKAEDLTAGVPGCAGDCCCPRHAKTIRRNA